MKTSGRSTSQNDDWNRLKEELAVITEFIYNGHIPPLKNIHQFLAIKDKIMGDNPNLLYCPTCGSCGETECCPPSRCKFGLDYIGGLRKELERTRKALGAYIEKAGYKNVTEQIINQEIKYYDRP